MSFIIEINGKDITSIEDLRENFDCGILLNYKDNFEDWLSGWDYYDEAAQVRELPPDLSDNAWLEEIAKILSVPVTVCEQAANRYQKKIAEEEAQAAEEQKRLEEEKQREADKQRTINVPITVNNIAIEILPETNSELPAVCGIYGDALFVTKESGWFFAPTSEKLFKSTDSGKTWERIWYDGAKIFYHNNYWITSGYDRIKFTADLKIWQDVSGPSVLGLDDKILFDGKNYIACISALGKNGYWIWGSENLTDWRKLADYGYAFQDVIFNNKFFLLQSMCSDGSGRNVCIADSLEKLCLPLKSRHCQDFVADDAGRFIGYAGEKFLLTKGTNSFWVTSDFEEFHYFTGVATAVEDLIICCDADGFWVSSTGKPKTWRKMNIKPPFKIDKLAYDNGTLIMYNGDSSKVCVAKVYAKEDTEFIMPVDDATLVFERGFCCTGRVKQGKIKIGDIVNICDKSEKILTSAKILEINQYGKTCEFAKTGDIVGICLPGTDDLYRVFAGKAGKEFILKI